MTTLTTYEPKPLKAATLTMPGVSEQTMTIHHGKLYAGYVKKMKEITARLEEMRTTGDGLETGNQIYSEMRGLKVGETFATNGTYLHEVFFEGLGGDGTAHGPLKEAIEARWGSIETWEKMMIATGMSVRGWVILAWDSCVGELRIFGADAQNHGGVWGSLPVIAIDVYEHAYFIDHGADRGAYLKAVFSLLDWNEANRRFATAAAVRT